MVSVNGAVAVAWLLSVACTVKLYVPAELGAPLRVPPAESVRPGGSVPVTDHV